MKSRQSCPKGSKWRIILRKTYTNSEGHYPQRFASFRVVRGVSKEPGSYKGASTFTLYKQTIFCSLSVNFSTPTQLPGFFPHYNPSFTAFGAPLTWFPCFKNFISHLFESVNWPLPSKLSDFMEAPHVTRKDADFALGQRRRTPGSCSRRRQSSPYAVKEDAVDFWTHWQRVLGKVLAFATENKILTRI